MRLSRFRLALSRVPVLRCHPLGLHVVEFRFGEGFPTLYGAVANPHCPPALLLAQSGIARAAPGRQRAS